MFVEGDCPSMTECIIFIQKGFCALCSYFVFILAVFYKFMEANRHFMFQMYSDVFDLFISPVNHKNWAMLSHFSPSTLLVPLPTSEF